MDPKHFMTDAELEAERRASHERAAATESVRSAANGTGETPGALAIGAWLAVGIPQLRGLDPRQAHGRLPSGNLTA